MKVYLHSMRLLLLLATLVPTPASAQDLALVEGIEAQPLAAQARRVAQALELAGAPLSPERLADLNAAVEAGDEAAVVAGVQRALDPLCLAAVHVNPESRVKVAPGPAPRELAQDGWRVFLVKVVNEAGINPRLRCQSPNAETPYVPSWNVAEPASKIEAATLRDRWLAIDLGVGGVAPELSGLGLEYHTLGLWSRDAGMREAKLVFDVGQGTQDLGFRAEADLLFRCAPAVPVTLRVADHDGEPTTASFVVRDAQGRVHPNPSRRLEPDFFFQTQVYRSDGETLSLTPGRYDVSWSRGPEYRVSRRTIVVPEAREGEGHEESFHLERWIDLASMGWYSGDHHVHAAGCAHYDAPTQGVHPEAMLRHVVGEDLQVGCVLTWGPCWYFQKGFFGETHSGPSGHRIRYDVEVSGFPSSHCGHLVLLRLTEDDYPGTTRIEQWPSWDLPVLQWAKEQGAVVGFAHSGWGLEVPCDTLPCWEMPRFDGIGANEYVVDVTHGAVDFISTVDTPSIWELNVWYHTLNAGFEARISGETDFPCIYGERVGLGRSYVQLDGELSFDAWVDGLRAGRAYVTDGLSHLIDFEVGGLAVGETAGGRPSVLAAEAGETLTVRARVAALLPEEGDEALRTRPLEHQPYWHLERARIPGSRRVPLELVVNGEVAAAREIEADGSQVAVTFEIQPARSSWIALRILPSSHTNPVFVELDGRPVRASRRSAEWCAEAVEVCWGAKHPGIREQEREAARRAYDAAAAEYRRRAEEADGQ